MLCAGAAAIDLPEADDGELDPVARTIILAGDVLGISAEGPAPTAFENEMNTSRHSF
jgi:ribosomal protein S10